MTSDQKFPLRCSPEEKDLVETVRETRFGQVIAHMRKGAIALIEKQEKREPKHS